MPATTVPSTAPDPTRLWAAVGDHLEAFAGAWAAGGDPPDPARFLPEGPPPVRRMILVELVKYDIDQRIGRKLDRPLEDYLRAFPELAAGEPPADLLYEDFHLRRQAGQSPDPADYFRRFPGRAAELGRLLGGTAQGRSTAAHAVRVPAGFDAGDRVDEFDLLALLGEGQFARVFLARQRGMQRLVALKVSADRGAEAETLAQLDHPHIVRVYDQRAVPGRGVRLVYMPYLPGGTLHEVVAHAKAVPADRRSGRTLLEAVDAALERRGETPPAASAAREVWAGRSWAGAVCAVGAKLAAALDHAHRHDVLHRDVKPANVLLTAEAEPLLADFNVGCCSKLDGAGPAAFFGGSLGYMAPEHLEAFDPAHPRPAESLDGRADVFGLAVTLWELATGSRPFGPEAFTGNWPTVLAALAERRRAGPDPTAVAAFPAGLPGLREVLLRCLDPDPDRRPATAG
ncbi:MAG: serine/threonine protein kinase, partial [Gemmataceae bacterium]|nr:serine/threonine protein kinase [Gemmataceae bacterium]